MPIDDRPREKLILRGPQNLADHELVAILLRTGTKGNSVLAVAQQLIEAHGNITRLADQSIKSITKQTGIGKDKAATLVAAFELSRRIKFLEKWYKNKKITCPQDVADIFIPIVSNELQEVFYVVCLNTANQIIKYEKITVGLVNSGMAHAREVYRSAIENNSTNIILIHNHPSGNLEPSREDIQLTKRLVEAGKIIGIDVFDHLIIGHDKFLSMVDKKLI